MRHVPVLTLLVTTAAAAQPQMATYVNTHYGYAVRYPASLLKPVAHGDSPKGRAFTSTVGHAGFRVFAGSMGTRSPAQFADDVQKVCPGGHPSYRVAKPTLVAVSCQTGDHIVYQKSLLRDGVAITVRGEYPARERTIWDPVVTSMARSMAVADFP